MMVLKCKMCGGDLEVNEKMTVGICGFCGTQQTLPQLDDERRTNLYNRANHYRRMNDFDKAMGIYGAILNENDADAEAHWGVVLARFGIEYVEDPQSHEMLPTCHRVQSASVLSDPDYLAAVQFAPDSEAGQMYREQAQRIADIQKQILAVSEKEDPYDVFICYKETGEDGSRTRDSALAQDIYYQLTQEGFRVFFARITLEDKLGVSYEPYIFAALNSAKVMVVVGTKPENFNSIWVRNEWSRYLSLISSGAKKTLIPAYRDMDPYDLPDEFANLQALDMGKIGFAQDLIRGIKKVITGDGDGQVQTSAGTAADQVAPLLKRAFICLEDGYWEKADDLLEQVLNYEPENAKAYIGKLMASMKIKKEEELSKAQYPLTENPLFIRAIGFADEGYKAQLTAYNVVILERKEQEKAALLEREEQEKKASVYNQALSAMNSSTDESNYLVAARLFKTIPQYKDADDLAVKCETLAQEAKRRRKKVLKILAIVVPPTVLVIIFLILLNSVIVPSYRYNKAAELLANEEYDAANLAFKSLGSFRDSGKKAAESLLQKAQGFKDAGEHEKAFAIYEEVFDYYYEISREKTRSFSDDDYEAAKYNIALEYMDLKYYEEAAEVFYYLYSYKDSKSLRTQCMYEAASEHMKNKAYSEAVKQYSALGNYKDSAKQRQEAMYLYALSHKQSHNVKTVSYLLTLTYEGYKDSEAVYRSLNKWSDKWSTNVVVNKDTDDKTTDMSTIVCGNYVVFHVKLSGGSYGESIRIKRRFYWDDGTATTPKVTDFEVESGGGCYFGWYEGNTLNYKGIVSIELSAPSGEIIGYKSVRIVPAGNS